MHPPRRVVLTRTPADNAHLRTLLTGLAAEIVERPCIAIEFVSQVIAANSVPADAPEHDSRPEDAIRRKVRAGTYDAAIFVSRHAVDALLATPLPPPRHVVALGTSTAAALRARGWPVTAIPTEARAEIAAAELDTLVADASHVLVVRGDLGGDVIREALGNRQIRVDEAIVYRTLPLDPAPLPPFEGETLVVFASPSAVTAFLRAGVFPFATPPLCIGETTARVCKEAGLSPQVADETTSAGLARAVRAWVASSGQGKPANL